VTWAVRSFEIHIFLIVFGIYYFIIQFLNFCKAHFLYCFIPCSKGYVYFSKQMSRAEVVVVVADTQDDVWTELRERDERGAQLWLCPRPFGSSGLSNLTV
jgi:hypothetical protein